MNPRPGQDYGNVKSPLLTFGIGKYIAIFLENSGNFYSKTKLQKLKV